MDHAADAQLLARHTARARDAIARACDEARELGHNYVGTEHLLLGVLADPAALSARVVDELGVPVDQLRSAVKDAAGPASPPATADAEVPFTPRARRVLDLVQGESRGLGHNYVGTEHYLLALAAEGDGVAARVLREQGLTVDQVRAGVVRLLTAYIAKKAR
jgi:ATP-dependent Clp protease ATP-binding subunit ClpC